MGGVRFLFPRWGRLARGGRSSLPGPIRENRRSMRMAAAMPVLVYGRIGNEPFAENTETMDVSSNGAFMPMNAPVAWSQRLILTNLRTNQEQACRVARIITTEQDVTYVALEFLQPSPDFWGALEPQGKSGHTN